MWHYPSFKAEYVRPIKSLILQYHSFIRLEKNLFKSYFTLYHKAASLSSSSLMQVFINNMFDERGERRKKKKIN